MSDSIHVAVMTSEVMDALKPQAGGAYLDATLGGGTHTAALLERSAPDGRVLSLDVDPAALERARSRFTAYGSRFTVVEGNFRDLARIAREKSFAPLDGVVIDLGVSSDELLDPTKGLSFQVAGPLDMRLGPKANAEGLTAAEIANSWPEARIAEILREYGEERYARGIAAALVEARKGKKIVNTLDLADIVRSAVPASYERGRIHPATRTFQALRIAVNDELEALKEAIEGARAVLKPDGIIAVISFHSLDDRIVKQAFRSAEDLEPLTKKPLMPSEEEQSRNPRARSAKLRAARKIQHSKSQISNHKNKTYGTSVRALHDQAA